MAPYQEPLGTLPGTSCYPNGTLIAITWQAGILLAPSQKSPGTLKKTTLHSPRNHLLPYWHSPKNHLEMLRYPSRNPLAPSQEPLGTLQNHLAP